MARSSPPASLYTRNFSRGFALQQLLWFCALLGTSHLWAAPLPALGADEKVTVSGVSSGGYMAVQFHIAHSARVAGAAAIAGGPYYCAQGSLRKAYHNCMKPGRLAPLPSMGALRAEVEELGRKGRIDPTANLVGSRVWLFSGANDHTVTQPVVEALYEFYSTYKPVAALVRHKNAGHAMVTDDAGNKNCASTDSPFINDCDYDAAGALLEHLLGPLSPPAPKPTGRLETFDQAAFGAQEISLDDAGYVYIPRACEASRCRVHVAFHGCRQGRASVNDRFAREAGYNGWADANRIIVLYPQVVARSWPIYNPNGCWDWWGYTGANYHTKEGAQIRALKAMLDRLSEARK